MPDSEAEILEDAKRLIKQFGSRASAEAYDCLQDAVRSRDAEMISYWRNLIAALPRVQPKGPSACRDLAQKG
jgi:hypothetical protein